MSQAPITNNFLKNMMVLNDNRTKRISSWDQTGGNKDCFTLKPGETQTIFEVDGPAIINHFYVTMRSWDLFGYRRVIVRMFWDGEETPSVEVPIGDFFGIPFSQPVFFSSMLVSVNPGRDRITTDGLNIYFPMPFAKHARIEIFNDSEAMLSNFWYHINYEELPAVDSNWGYFHSCWNRENPCEAIVPEGADPETMMLGSGINLDGDENYVILDAEGCGNYAGCILQVQNLNHGWYGEGDDMIFIDGEKWPPSLHGTGSEEIFGGGACPNEAYFTPYCGFHQVETAKDFYGRNAMYKFFVVDPVRFQKSIRVTIEHGHANNLGNDYASVAYWYQDEPHKKRAPLSDPIARIPRFADEDLAKAADNVSKAGAIFGELQEVLTPKQKAPFRLHWERSKAAIVACDAKVALKEGEDFAKMAEGLKKKHLQ